MPFADIRTEWRVNDIERSLQNKADFYQVSSVSSNVDRLERTVRELSAEVTRLRYELESCQDKVAEVERHLEASD